MPIYEITAPDGKTYEIEGPPGASRQDVIKAIIARNPSAGQPPAPPKEGDHGCFDRRRKEIWLNVRDRA